MGEAEQEEIDLTEYITEYLSTDDNHNPHFKGIHTWATDLSEWCRKEIPKIERKESLQAVAAQVQAKLSAPVSNELLTRYQVALDGELYKAAEALRKQQEWRLKGGMTVEAEAA